MSMQYPIADMFTLIRNGQFANKNTVITYKSNFKLKILKILMDEGFIKNLKVIKDLFIEIELKYFNNKPVIDYIQCSSTPGLRKYIKKHKIKSFMSGMGTMIISTSKGLMTDKKARKMGIGGEVICYIS